MRVFSIFSKRSVSRSNGSNHVNINFLPSSIQNMIKSFSPSSKRYISTNVRSKSPSRMVFNKINKRQYNSSTIGYLNKRNKNQYTFIMNKIFKKSNYNFHTFISMKCKNSKNYLKNNNLYTMSKRFGNIDASKDYYKDLEIKKTATQKEIKEAFHKLTKKWHPDIHATKSEAQKKKATEMFQKIANAYDVLGSEDSRKQYDDMRRLGQSNPWSTGRQGGSRSSTSQWSNDGYRGSPNSAWEDAFRRQWEQNWQQQQNTRGNQQKWNSNEEFFRDFWRHEHARQEAYDQKFKNQYSRYQTTYRPPSFLSMILYFFIFWFTFRLILGALTGPRRGNDPWMGDDPYYNRRSPYHPNNNPYNRRASINPPPPDTNPYEDPIYTRKNRKPRPDLTYEEYLKQQNDNLRRNKTNQRPRIVTSDKYRPPMPPPVDTPSNVSNKRNLPSSSYNNKSNVYDSYDSPYNNSGTPITSGKIPMEPDGRKYLDKEIQRFYEGPMSNEVKRNRNETDEEFMMRVRQAAEERRRQELDTNRRRQSRNLSEWDQNNRNNSKW